MPPRSLIVGNWKMHKTPGESASFLEELLASLGKAKAGREVAVAPGFLALREAAGILEGSPVALAAQNAHWEDEGPFTGEVSARFLADIGCRYVILGHSERRQHFGETDRQVNRKARAVLHHGMIPIVCVGEKAEEREEGRAFQVVQRQLRHGLADLGLGDDRPLVVAYEPVWAIGTGKNATPEEAGEMHRSIREVLEELLGGDLSRRVGILYGGSVSPANAGSLLSVDDIDGALVGGASLETASFLAICQAGAGRGAP